MDKEKDINSEIDEETENLDDNSEYVDSSYNDSDDTSLSEDTGSEQSNYNPQNRYRRNQQYHSRQYYKDKVDESKNKRDEAKKNADEARANRQSNRDALRNARREGNRENVNNRKEDYKNAKKKDRQAKREYKDAKRANRQAKFDRANDMANRVLHPGETAKNYVKDKINQHNPINKLKNKVHDKINVTKDKAKQGVKNAAKKAGNTAKKGVKKAGNAAAKGVKTAGKSFLNAVIKILAKIPPPVWIGVGVAIIIFIVALLIMIIFIGAEDEALTGLAATTCTYENVGGISEDTFVSITDCNTGEVFDSVKLEKYIAGVALNSLGTNYNSEVMKATLIILRSSIIANSMVNTDNSYNVSRDVITVSQCNQKNFYWDYTKDLYKSDDEIPVYSYDANSGYPLYKKALEQEDIIQFESTAKQVSCMYLTDSDGNVVNALVTDDTINKLSDQAVNNDGSDNGSYAALLLQNFDNAKGIASGQTNNASYFSDDVGEYSQWKQLCSLNAPWCNVCMNKKCDVKVNSYGCALVSLSMLIAHSGADTSKIPNFNPGTFVDAMRNNGYLGNGGGISNWAHVTKLVPSFVFHKRIKGLNGDINMVRAYAEQGYFLVLEVKSHKEGSEHYVAVDNSASAKADWSDVYIWDPARNITHLKEYSGYQANKILIYELKH